jgi:hypothetical protein
VTGKKQEIKGPAGEYSFHSVSPCLFSGKTRSAGIRTVYFWLELFARKSAVFF